MSTPFVDPTYSVLKPTGTADAFFNVVAGASRSVETINLPVGISLINVDWTVPVGYLNARLRLFSNNNVSFPVDYTRMEGSGTVSVRVVNDDSTAWVTIQGTATSSTLATARVGVTIYPAA